MEAITILGKGQTKSTPAFSQHYHTKHVFIQSKLGGPVLFTNIKDIKKTEQLVGARQMAKSCFKSRSCDLERVVVNEVLKCCPKPLKKHTDAIAKKIVNVHTASLCDQKDGEVLMRIFSLNLKQELKTSIGKTPPVIP